MSAMSALVASKIRKPSSPSTATGAKPHGFADSRAHVLDGRMRQDAVQDAGPVEPGRYREPPGYGGGPEPADLLHPPDVQLQVRPLCGQRVQAALGEARRSHT